MLLVIRSLLISQSQRPRTICGRDDQKDIDYYWGKLSAVREAEQCGWLKGKYGVSWQISPKVLAELMKGDQAQVDRVTQAFLQMKKFDIAELERAAQGREFVGGRTTA